MSGTQRGGNGMDDRLPPTKTVMIGRAVPTLPGVLVVAMLAGFAGLLVGWQLAAGARAPSAASAAPTVTLGAAPLVRPATVDDALHRAYLAAGQPGTWLLCRMAATLECRGVEPIRLGPSEAFGRSGGLWSSLSPVAVSGGVRFAIVADLSYAVGATVLLTEESRGFLQTADVTEGGGVHYVDLGVLSAGRYAIVVEAELGPPMGGLVEALGLDVTGP